MNSSSSLRRSFAYDRSGESELVEWVPEALVWVFAVVQIEGELVVLVVSDNDEDDGNNGL